MMQIFKKLSRTITPLDRISFSLELRKILSYRFEFWLSSMGQITLNLFIPYFVWFSIFQSKGIQSLYGFNLKDYVFYYLCCYFTVKMLLATGSSGQISQEIYLGGLNKYLIYPLSFQRLKLMSFFAYVFFYGVQFFFALIIHKIIWGNHVSIMSMMLYLLAVILSSLIAFYLICIIEYIAFWADNVWTLHVALRVMLNVLGGFYLPIFTFPDKFQALVYITPFPAMIYVPVGILMGFISTHFIFQLLLLQIFWIIILQKVATSLWNKGRLQYTGIGI